MTKVLFVTPYPHNEAPSQRFRFEQYYRFFPEQGIQYDINSFLDIATWQLLYKPGHQFRKVIGILMGFLRRFVMLFKVPAYDFIFIHREATPIGPPIFEWIIAKVLRKKIIYDFDDAIWLPNTSASNSIVAGIKWHGKVRSICKWAYKVSCGNEYLCDFARQYNSNVVLNPTTIDTEHYHNKVKDQNTPDIVIGWTGTHSTITYLEQFVPLLQKLEEQHRFRLVVISDKEPSFQLRSLEFVKWRKETEIEDLLRFNTGIMPLTDDPWARGKCGFKALQYMALGMPAIVSPVGVNTRIVSNGINGYLCDTPAEWEAALTTLITDKQKRTEMGQAARLTIESTFSVRANLPIVSSLFT